MKRLFISLMTTILLALGISSTVYGGGATFSWTPNTENNLEGYKIHSSKTGSGEYDTTTDVGNPPNIEGTIYVTIEGYLPGTTYYFVATAYDVDGFESEYSTEVVWIAPESIVFPPQPGETRPNPPGLMILPAVRNADGTYSTNDNGVVVVTTPIN
jgi:hypothetical protein